MSFAKPPYDSSQARLSEQAYGTLAQIFFIFFGHVLTWIRDIELHLAQKVDTVIDHVAARAAATVEKTLFKNV